GRSLSFFSRFGLAGDMANLELMLILRHKKSRTYLFIYGLFLLYGLFFYSDDSFTTKTGFYVYFMFISIFITGIFLIQYGKLLFIPARRSKRADKGQNISFCGHLIPVFFIVGSLRILRLEISLPASGYLSVQYRHKFAYHSINGFMEAQTHGFKQKCYV